MKILYIRLRNYIGIYNGIGSYEMYIDFTKCKSNTILIKGDNGSGKSTLLSSINPLPEDNIYFIPGMTASKEIGYFDDITGVRYDITYIHESKESSESAERCTAKGYIKKTLPDGSIIELNPTGKITPCKSIVYEEFELDPCYLSLIKMNTQDKGLVSKTPAERKAYSNSILSVTQPYNEIYKSVSKVYSLLKDNIKRISAKIDMIGNPEKLNIEYQTALDALEKLKNQEASLNRAIISSENTMDTIDSTGDISTRYCEIRERLDQISKERTSLTHSIPRDSVPPENIDYEISSRQNAIAEMNTKYTANAVRIESLLKDQEYDSADLMEKIAKLESINDTSTINELKDAIDTLGIQINKIDIELKGLGIDPNTKLRTDDFNVVFDVFERLRVLMYDMYDREILAHILNNRVFVSMCDTYPMYLSAMASGRTTVYQAMDLFDTQLIRVPCKVPDNYLPRDSSLSEKELIYRDYLKLVETASRINDRPRNCESSQCPFIKDALQASKKLESFPFTQEDFRIEMMAWRESDSDIKLARTANSIIEPLSREIYNIFKSIIANASVFNEISSLLNIDMTSAKGFIHIMKSIFNKNFEFEKSNVYRAFNGRDNIFMTRESLVNQQETYKAQIVDLKAKNQLISVISSDIDKLRSKIGDISAQLEANTVENTKIETTTAAINKVLEKLTVIKGIYTSIETLNKEEADLSKERLQIENQAKKYDDARRVKTEACKHLESVSNQIKSTETHKSELEYNLRMIQQYQQELGTITHDFKRIELIRYYTSPTKDGIQNVFAAMYMNDIVIDANRILSGLFGGNLTILPFVINDTEFRIPIAVANGLPHDDVKSLSAGQSSLISLIISYALVRKSSSKLNILTADELDGPLDPYYRREFINTLHTVMNMVGATQSILISHNSEMNLSECDIVLLKNDNADRDNIKGNLIWSYYSQD